jgi:hypothetical protein
LESINAIVFLIMHLQGHALAARCKILNRPLAVVVELRRHLRETILNRFAAYGFFSSLAGVLELAEIPQFGFCWRMI